MLERIKKHVVILGGSFAGAYCAQRLQRLIRNEPVNVTLIDQNNYFIFYPLLVETGTGSIHPRHAVISLRSFLKSVEFRKGEVLDIGSESRTVSYLPVGLSNPNTISYDHLVIALGSVTRLPKIPGLSDFAFEIKTLSDAVALRDRAIEMLEEANNLSDGDERRRRLHLIVVGGNFTGVEVAGEFDAFLKSASRTYSSLNQQSCKVTLIEQGTRILTALDERSGGYAMKQMQKRGIDVLLKSSVKEVYESGVRLADGSLIAGNTVIWCAGIAPNPLLSSLPFQRDLNGYLLCEEDLRLRGQDNVWGIGDCAVNPAPDGGSYPATAQHAVREGEAAADNIIRALHHSPLKPCRIRSQGSLAAIGCRRGVAKIFGLNFSGRFAWFLWRTVYLVKMPGLARKLRVAADWTIDSIFPKDYVQLGIHRIERTTEGYVRIPLAKKRANE